MNLSIEQKCEALKKANVFIGGLNDEGVEYYYAKLVKQGKIA
jgi:hypothetical protein